ncbi:hypothetical protein ACFQ10_02440 [Streptomyces indonesiensis]
MQPFQDGDGGGDGLGDDPRIGPDLALGHLVAAADPARFLALVEEFTQATSPADGSREHWRLLVEGEPGRTPDDPHGAVNRALEREFREASERSAT